MGGGGGSGYVNMDKCIDGSLFPMTPASCAAAAEVASIELGGAGYKFAGDFGTSVPKAATCTPPVPTVGERILEQVARTKPCQDP
jgi:hypothetical protein